MFGWTQAIVLLVLIAVMFSAIIFTKITKRRTDEDVVYGHRVLWDE